jgi:hypothetical protein
VDHNELVSTIFLLVMAGFDTTVNLIASGTLALLTHPGEKTRLRQDPSQLPAAVEWSPSLSASPDRSCPFRCWAVALAALRLVFRA